MNVVEFEDIEQVNSCKFIDWNKIDNHSFLITGATGMIGSNLIKILGRRNRNIKFVLPVRNVDKAKKILENTDNIKFISTNIENFEYDEDVDYVIHAASPTKSMFFVENPVETLNTSVMGTSAVLNYCRNHSVKSYVYTSSMEMYGITSNQLVSESDIGYIDLLNVRSSYSEGKRTSELYSYAYFKEYGIPIKIARLAMTFGAGLLENENRVYKYFCDCILNKKNIVLKSSGNTIVNYCYITDAILAILKILIDGNDGNAYNVCADSDKMTIKDCAEYLIDKYSDNRISKLEFDISDFNEFAPENHMVLKNEKIKSLGWEPKYNLKEGYDRLIRYLRDR